MRTEGWKAFLGWSVLGGLYGYAVLGMMSIGIFVLILAIGATFFAAQELRIWPEILGLAMAVPFVLGWVAWRSWPLPQCQSGEQRAMAMSSGSGSLHIHSGAHYSETVHLGCTTLNVQMLAWSAAALVIATLVAYIIAKHLRAEPART